MLDIKYNQETIDTKRNAVKNRLFKESENIKSLEFKAISNEDLEILFNLYDEIFLQNWFKNNFKGEIKFKLSRQLKRSAGNTKTAKNISQLKEDEIKFEIKISINHLASFDAVKRNKYVGGVKANDKLEGIMLVLEHEMCHVVEFLLFNTSDCNKQTFKDIIYNIFGQTESNHQLVSKEEANYQKYGLKVGNKVRFDLNGFVMKGIINGINTRATVMSPAEYGKYIDKSGQRYNKYYVPLQYLTKE